MPARAATTAEGQVTLTQPTANDLSVDYENGQLKIDARNVPFGEVAFAVCSRIGAWFDAPFGSEEPLLNQPVEVHLGPGPAREVLVALLKSSPLAFGISGLPNDPAALAQVSIYAERAEPPKEKLARSAEAAPRSDEAAPRSDDAKGDAELPSPQMVAMQLSDMIAEAREEMASAEENDGDADMLQALESAIFVAAAGETTEPFAAAQGLPADPDGFASPRTRQFVRSRRR